MPTTSVHASSAATTTAVLEAPAAPSIESPALPAPTLKAARPVKAAAAPKERRGFIAIGGQPRVDLLPLEVRAERKAGLVVRRAWLGVAAAVVLMGIVTGASTLYANNATTSLASTQAETTALTTQQSKYSAVKTTQSEVGLIQAAQSVGGSTDVDWAGYLEKVALTVPTGVSVTSLSVSSTSPVLALAQPMSPLQGQRVATLSFEITATSLPAITTWLNTLPTLKGYVDASASSASSESGGYTASVTLHINQKVFTNTYTKGN
ncbi:hypothetical protein [Frondihabitans sp. PAMC 28766]|uniref:hypothetical protein n=1 Tax=Frondihabitans sp. PAMC 28766 TaxID=1795630 RepID=UPI0012FF9CA6|nr:hypothetical protein [Frondihabitans sp. PAMC 28766]